MLADIHVVIDLGHGGHDPGATGGGLKEADQIVPFGVKLGWYLKTKYKIRVEFTRYEGQYKTLAQRVAFAKKIDAKSNTKVLFISIHMNGATASSAEGVEVLYYPKGANKWFAGELLTAILRGYAKNNITMRNRGLKRVLWPYVLRRTPSNIWSCLLELGFITNTHDRSAMTHKNSADLVGLSLANAVAKAVGVKPVISAPPPEKKYVVTMDSFLESQLPLVEKTLKNLGWYYKVTEKRTRK